MEYIFLEVINGVPFQQIAEGLASKRYMNFARVYQDVEESYFLSNPSFAFLTGEAMESTFLDMFMRRKDFYFSNMMRPVSSISVNHTFKVSKSIGGFRLQDSKFINENMKLFIVLKEEGLVVNWKLTKTTTQKKN